MSIFSWRTFLAGMAHWLSGAIWYTVFAATFAAFIGPEGIAQLTTRNEPLALALAFVSSLAVAGALGYTLRRGGSQEAASTRRLLVLWILVVAAGQAPPTLFETRHPGLFWLGAGQQLFGMGAACVVLTFRNRFWSADAVANR